MIWTFALATALQLLAWRLVFARAFASPPALPKGEGVATAYGSVPPPLPTWEGVNSHAVAASSPPGRAGGEVSVIVCFHNEASTLEHCLRSILAQDDPAFEVVAVDDNSTDDSAALVTELQFHYPNLRLVRPGPTRPGKKDALTAGVAAARHECLLLTDADCAPASPQWLSQMTAPLAAENEVVLGCSPYTYRPGPLNFWQRYEATYTALQYLGFARLGAPYMGVGRNLAYRKSFFLRAGGLARHAHLPGGDDDLLVNHHAPANATTRVVHPAAWTYSAPSLNWRDYLQRKLRHQSIGPLYRRRHQLLLTTLALSHGLFYLLGFLLLFTPYRYVALYGYVVRMAVVWEALNAAHTRQFLAGGPAAGGSVPPANDRLWLPVADLLQAPFYVFLLLGSLWGRRGW